jgi:hypothetical protein
MSTTAKKASYFMYNKCVARTGTLLILLLLPLLLSCKGSPPVISTEETAENIKPTTTFTPTLTLQPKATKTSMPTLTAFEREVQIKELISTNAECELPCWWGFKPGLTSWETVSAFLDSLGAKSSIYEENGLVLHYAGGFDLNREKVFNNVAFQESNDIISSVVIDASGFNDSLNFKNVWVAYSPENILLKYGVPSRVWISSRSSVHEGAPGSSMPYSIWLFYDHLGILIRYSGQVDFESNYKMCPVFSEQGNLSDDIDIYLQSADSAVPLENLPTVESNAKDALPLEEAAGISINEFYGLLTKLSSNPCIETPKSIWP